MKVYIKILLLVLVTAGFTVKQSVLFSTQDEIKKESTAGVVIRVDEENLSVYVKSEARMLRFKADLDTCISMKDGINRYVNVIFARAETGELVIISFHYDEDDKFKE